MTGIFTPAYSVSKRTGSDGLFLSAFVVLVGAELNTEMELQTAKDTTAGPTKPMGDRDAHAADHVAEAPR
jgi:membrane protein